MDEAESKAGATVGTGSDEVDRDRPSTAAPRASVVPAAAERGAPSVSPLRIRKPGQGLHLRWGTAIGAGIIALAATHFVWDRIRIFAVIEGNPAVRTLIPVILLVAAAYFIFWLVGRSQTVVDFMIATEGEMKKVNWSTRREVWGATRIVIVTLFALGLVLAIVDAVFIVLFSEIGVLQFNVIKQFFSGGNV